MIHSIIPPSSSGIWGSPNGCTGWVLMSQQYPDLEDSQDAKEGSATHEIGSVLINEMSRGFYHSNFKDFDGKLATNGILFTEEMFEAANTYANDVNIIMRNTSIYGGKNIGIEKRIECKRIHDISFGTPDSWIYDRKSKRLYIWDFKYGHRVVEVYECWQLLNYLAGLFDLLDIDGIKDQEITVHMRIVQPRAFHRDGIIREWKTKACNLRGYFNILRSKADEALGSNSVIRSGPHCRDCSARHACPAALQGGINLYEVASQPVPAELSPIALGLQLSIIKRAIKQLEYIDTGISAQVEGMIKLGKLVPGWAMEAGKGKEIWSKPTAEIISLGKLLGHDLKKPDAAITVKQTRAKGMDESMIKQFSTKSQPGRTLAPDNGNKLKRLFS